MIAAKPTRSPRRLPPTSSPTFASSDISFLADASSHRAHAKRPQPTSSYGGSPREWRDFQRSLDSRRLYPIRAEPAKLPPQTPASPHSHTSPWATRGYTQNSVATLLFPAEAQRVEAAIVMGSRSPHRPQTTFTQHPQHPQQLPQQLPPPHPSVAAKPQTAQPQFARPPGAVALLDSSTFSEPSGRAQALRLATSLASEVGPHFTPGLPPALTPHAESVLAIPTDQSAADLVRNHQELLALSDADVVPHLGALDRAASDLVRQVGGHCAEQAIVVEYLRRHHVAAAGAARTLLARLQHAVGMYEELRQAMDGSLLQRFQDSLGDAFTAINDSNAPGVAPAQAPRGTTASAVSYAAPPDLA